MPGTTVPGVMTAGTFYQDGKRVFWEVHHPEKTIVIDLHDERYNELVVEVDDPDAAVKLIGNSAFRPKPAEKSKKSAIVML
jgi:roadblock/LC7 domain-containing protein